VRSSLLPLVFAGMAAGQVYQFTTTGTLTPGTVGQGYSVFVGTNSTATVSSCNPNIVSGFTLPPGLAMTPSGSGCAITGTPTAPGTYRFYATATNVLGQTTQVGDFTITIGTSSAGPVQISTTTITPATVGVPYSFTFRATVYGNPPDPSITLLWSILGGTPPPGLTLASNGVFSGTPTNSGSYTFQVQVLAPQLDASDNRQFTIFVTTGQLRIIESSLPFGVQGQAYSTTVRAEGGAPPYQWSLGGTTLQGLSIDALTGAITGTPQNAGSFPFPVTVRDQAGNQFTFVFTLFVATPLSVLTSSLPNGTPGVSYSQQLQAGGGQGPYTWAITAGNLPNGLTLNTATGAISGTPTAEGRFQFTVRVTDAGGRTATKELSVLIGQTVQITTTSLPEAAVNVAYAATLAATGGQGPYTWSVSSGTLPPGLTLAASTGAISGTPTTVGSYSFTVKVTDNLNSTAEKVLSINVVSPLSITTSTAAAAIRGVAYSQAFGATGGTPPYTWAVVGGALPSGLLLNASTAVVSGTPTTTGTFTFTLQVRDAAGQTATRAYTITVGEPLTIVTDSFTGAVNTPFSQTLAASGGTSPYTWAVASGTLPAGLSLNPATGAITGTPTAAGTSTVTFRLTDSRQQTTTKAVAIAINLPAVTGVNLSVTNPGGAAVGPNQQPALGLTLGSAFPAAITGTLTLTFTPLAGADDPAVTFLNGQRTVTYTVAQGQTQATFPPNSAGVRTGTVAGTIVITARLMAGNVDVTPSPAPTQRIEIAAGPPVITSVQLQQATGSLNVIVTGYATTREMTSGLFRFAAATGSALAQAEFTVSLAQAFGAFFPNSTFGGQFTLTMPFGVSGGAASSVVGVSVSLTNARGNSNTASP
jgi:hypothetical protein